LSRRVAPAPSTEPETVCVVGNILVAWVLTLPAAALVGAGMEALTRLPAGDALVFGLAGVIAAVAFGARSLQTRRVAVAQGRT
jgi:predicted Kef-type K+ transport protein